VRLRSRRALLGLTSVLVATGLTLGAAPAVAAGPQAESTASWLASGLRGGHLSTTFDGVDYPNWGTTLDAALAFQELGVRPQSRPSSDPGSTTSSVFADCNRSWTSAIALIFAETSSRSERVRGSPIWLIRRPIMLTINCSAFLTRW